MCPRKSSCRETIGHEHLVGCIYAAIKFIVSLPCRANQDKTN